MNIKFWSSGFMIWNVLLLVYGIGFFVFGAYLKLHSPIYTDLSGEEISTSIAFLLMLMTITFCTVALIGVRAYLDHHPDSFRGYYIALTCVVFTQIILILLIFAFAHKIKNLIGRDLELTIKEKYGKSNEKSVSNSIDYIQSRYQCCGATDYQDYAESVYRWTMSATDRSESRFLPKSCCVNPLDPECNRVAIIKEFNIFYWEVGSNIIHTKGCLHQLQNKFVEESLPYLVGNFIALLILQILAILFAFYMEAKIYEEMGSNLVLTPQQDNLICQSNNLTPTIIEHTPYNVASEMLRQSTVTNNPAQNQHLNVNQTKLLVNYIKQHPDTISNSPILLQSLSTTPPMQQITLQPSTNPIQITHENNAYANDNLNLQTILPPLSTHVEERKSPVPINIVIKSMDVSKAPNLPVISEIESHESISNVPSSAALKNVDAAEVKPEGAHEIDNKTKEDEIKQQKN